MGTENGNGGNRGNTIMSEWQTRANLDQLDDTPPDGIPVVKDQLWVPVRVPADTYWESPPDPRSRWAQARATVRSHARVFVIVAIYLGAVAAISLIVGRAVHTPARGISAAGIWHQQEQGLLAPHPPTRHAPSAPHKSAAIRPDSPVFPSPGPSLFRPIPGSSQPLPGPSASSLPLPAPTPAPSATSPLPSSPPPDPPPTRSPPPPPPRPRAPRPRAPHPRAPPHPALQVNQRRRSHDRLYGHPRAAIAGTCDTTPPIAQGDGPGLNPEPTSEGNDAVQAIRLNARAKENGLGHI